MYPDLKGYTMKTHEVKQVLALARQEVSMLYITGGEPFVRKDLAAIVRWAKREAGFRYVAMTTNGVLIHRQEEILEDLDALVISLDSMDDDRYDTILNVGTGASRAIKNAILRYAALRSQHHYSMTVSCVIMPRLISHARDVLQFCIDNDIAFACMPQSIGPYPHPELRDNQEYQDFVDEVVALKKQGRPGWGSYPYFKTIRNFEKYQCYPTMAPRIFPNGDLYYPCSPLDKVAGNLIGAQSFAEVFQQGIDKHGPIPDCDTRCFASCYIEPSHAINVPSAIVWEHFDLWRALRRLVLRARLPKRTLEALPEVEIPDAALPPDLGDLGQEDEGEELVQIRRAQ
jgi:MoaA/NifB/PqqE/SkfB family radical SAM enzyme